MVKCEWDLKPQPLYGHQLVTSGQTCLIWSQLVTPGHFLQLLTSSHTRSQLVISVTSGQNWSHLPTNRQTWSHLVTHVKSGHTWSHADEAPIWNLIFRIPEKSMLWLPYLRRGLLTFIDMHIKPKHFLCCCWCARKIFDGQVFPLRIAHCAMLPNSNFNSRNNWIIE